VPPDCGSVTVGVWGVDVPGIASPAGVGSRVVLGGVVAELGSCVLSLVTSVTFSGVLGGSPAFPAPGVATTGVVGVLGAVVGLAVELAVSVVGAPLAGVPAPVAGLTSRAAFLTAAVFSAASDARERRAGGTLLLAGWRRCSTTWGTAGGCAGTAAYVWLAVV
jgi:hypothetical protein